MSSPKHACADCPQMVSAHATRCVSCAAKHREAARAAERAAEDDPEFHGEWSLHKLIWRAVG